jgi:hypothetical protein
MQGSCCKFEGAIIGIAKRRSQIGVSEASYNSPDPRLGVLMFAAAFKMIMFCPGV